MEWYKYRMFKSIHNFSRYSEPEKNAVFITNILKWEKCFETMEKYFKGLVVDIGESICDWELSVTLHVKEIKISE